MKLEKIDKKEEGKFITRYDITYKTVDDTTKIYEMISRNRNVQTREELRGNKPDAVVLMVTDESGVKNRFEQRIPYGRQVSVGL